MQKTRIFNEGTGCRDQGDECESCECAHSRCLNCQLKGRAFWYMMAKLAGWGDTSTTSITTETTTTSASISFCPIVTMYGEDSEKTILLRNYRDNVLRQAPEGRELIKLYYLWSPAIVRAMEDDEGIKKEVKQMINGVLPLIEDVMK